MSEPRRCHVICEHRPLRTLTAEAVSAQSVSRGRMTDALRLPGWRAPDRRTRLVIPAMVEQTAEAA